MSNVDFSAAIEPAVDQLHKEAFLGGSYAFGNQQQAPVATAYAYSHEPATPFSGVSATSASERANGESSTDGSASSAANDEETSDVAANDTQHEEAAPRQREYRPRIRRIHLPVREGADELSDDEGDGSEWAQPPEDAQLPPGYDGPRRVRPEGEKVRPDGKIKPSYYYPTEGSHRGIPVFEPTMEEFKDFNSFINKIDNYGMRSGVVKVVPPKEWLGSLPSITQPLKDTMIKDAIEQNFMGSQGLYRQSNIASRRLYNVKQWKELCESDKYRTPNFFGAPEEEKETPKPVKRPRKTSGTAASSAPKAAPAARGKRGRGRGRGGRRGGKASQARRAGSPAPSVASERTEATHGEAEDGETQDVDLDKLQDPDQADQWEKDLKDRKMQEDEEINRKAAAAIEAAGPEPEGGHQVGEIKMDVEPVGAVPASPESQKTISVSGQDAAQSAANPAIPPKAEPSANSVEFPSYTSHANSTDFQSQLASMPWQPTQVAWQTTQLNGSNTPAPSTINATTEFKPPASPTQTGQNGEAPTAQDSSASKVPAKRYIREEQCQTWDQQWETFDYTTLPYGAKPSDFTVEQCKQIEKMYWRRFTFGSPPMYGADGSGSLFDESVKDWNVAALDDLLMRVNPHMPMPGVNTPYLYFGMWRATFSWHIEDADLYSINYIHFGSPKFWYSIPQQSAERFERVMAGYFGNDRKKCPEFLRHKSFLVSPSKLAKDGIPLNRVVQFPGEIILTYPYGYHSGFNLGFNCAESINFATENWLDIGRKAKPCVCLPDTVRIDVDKWLEEARADAEKMRADPEYATQRKLERELAVNIPQHEAKRRRELGHLYEERRQQVIARTRVQQSPEYQAVGSKSRPAAPKPAAPTSGPAKPRKPSVAAQFAAAQARQANQAVVKGYYPCALCPEQITEGLVKIAPPQDANSKRASRPLYAHSICVTFTPTTWCAPHPLTGEEMVFGYDAIEKERWALKCGLCSNKHGTKIQCTKSTKCFRAFHATCALKEDSGVLLDALVNGKSVLDPAQDDEHQSPTAGDGHLQLVVTCRYHNPAWMRAQQERKKTELASRVAALQVHSAIQIRTTTGVYSVYVMAQRPDQNAVEIMFGDGTRALCKHGAIVWPEEANKAGSRTPVATQPVQQVARHPHARTAPQPQQYQQQPYPNYGYPAQQAGHPGYNNYQAYTQQYAQQYGQQTAAGSQSPWQPSSTSPYASYGQQTGQPTQVNPHGGAQPMASSYDAHRQSQQQQHQQHASGLVASTSAPAPQHSAAANPAYIPYAKNQKATNVTAVVPPASVNGNAQDPTKLTARQRAAFQAQQQAFSGPAAINQDIPVDSAIDADIPVNAN